MSTGDPRVQQHRPRLPKSYTDQQLAFLKSHLPEFERRTQGSIRGDAKKFALEKAADFINVFGLPNEFIHVEEAEPRFKEQIYNWFKNTVGRTRRKLEGRPRSMKKALEKGVCIWILKILDCQPTIGTVISGGPMNNTIDSTWITGNVLAAPIVMPYAQASVNSATGSPTQTLVSPVQYSVLRGSSIDPMLAHRQSSLNQQSPRQHHSSLELAVNLQITTSTLRDSFSQGIDATSLASMIQTFVKFNPSTTPLTPVITSLFEAITAEPSFSRDPRACLRRFLDASTLFPPSIVHAGVSGPLAGPRALQMQIRKNSIWFPNPPTDSTISSPSYSMSDELQRLANDRQRKKDHIQWARIHAAELELGMLNMEHSGHTDDSGYSYAMRRAFSEMTARDAVWEEDEVEWVAGIYVLRAVIRTVMQGAQRKREEYGELLATYERRLKDIRDENRQTMVAVSTLAARLCLFLI
ncbi:hypothetical protein F5050DRAFT_1575328 [Lentinula boryana]|uniref:Uncharacterized protein n=1 Tax=Lentinula boryana TaxID=40481 RepID=A0ABQ8Q7Z2_9AGAR|nr:hypothetical protein F5050DRAFT_1575328 [Lentinula boryana]